MVVGDCSSNFEDTEYREVGQIKWPGDNHYITTMLEARYQYTTMVNHRPLDYASSPFPPSSLGDRVLVMSRRIYPEFGGWDQWGEERLDLVAINDDNAVLGPLAPV